MLLTGHFKMPKTISLRHSLRRRHVRRANFAEARAKYSPAADAISPYAGDANTFSAAMPQVDRHADECVTLGTSSRYRVFSLAIILYRDASYDVD